MDAFASPATAQLPRYWVPAHHTLDKGAACGVDAFAQNWSGERLWVHPPASLIPHVIQMLERAPCQAMLCVPAWRTAPWLGVLAAISQDSVRLPRGCLRPVAADAPERLRSWPVEVFWINNLTATSSG